MSAVYTSNSIVFDKKEDKKEKEQQKYLSFRKQLTFHERERNDRFTIKSLIQNVKLKTRIRNLLEKLPSRRLKKMEDFHYNLVGDLSDKQMNQGQRKKNSDNQLNYEVPIFIHEAQASHQRKLKKLQSLINKQANMLNPLAILKGIQSKLSYKQIKIALANFINNLPLIDPNAMWKLIWDFLMCLQIMILCFVCSVRCSDINDSLSTYTNNNHSLVVAFVILQSIDMMLCASTGYYQRGRLVKQRESIIKRYLWTNGFLDTVTLQALIYELHRWGDRVYLDSTLPQPISSQFYEVFCQIEAVLLLLYFIKGMRITKLMLKLEEQFQLGRQMLNLLKLVKLFVFVLIVSHIFACIWLFTGKNSSLNVTWLTNYKLDNSPWKTQYIRSQYFATVTMITVGYGDTVPQNETEQIICMIGMMFTCGVFAYTINSIGNILSEMKQEEAQRKESMLIISQYMKEKNIQRNLQSEIREYLEYYWKEWSETQIEKEQQIISQLSEHLRRDLLYQANKAIIHETSLLAHYFSDFFIQKIINIIKEFKATPNQTIVCDQGSESRKGVVFFVEKGEFDIYHIPQSNTSNFNIENIVGNPATNSITPNSYTALENIDQNQGQGNSPFKLLNSQQSNSVIMKRIKTIGEGESFGFDSFFTDNPHKIVVKSKDFCKLLYIDRQDFIDLMQKHNLQEDYEKFCFIRDSLIYDNNLTLLGTKCPACKKFDHALGECSYVHYIANKGNLISRFNVTIDITDRAKKLRMPFKKHDNPLKHIIYYSESAFDYIEKNKSYIDRILNYEEYSYVSSFSDSSDFDEYDEYDEEKEEQEESKLQLQDKVEEEEEEGDVTQIQNSDRIKEDDKSQMNNDDSVVINNLNNSNYHKITQEDDNSSNTKEICLQVPPLKFEFQSESVTSLNRSFQTNEKNQVVAADLVQAESNRDDKSINPSPPSINLPQVSKTSSKKSIKEKSFTEIRSPQVSVSKSNKEKSRTQIRSPLITPQMIMREYKKSGQNRQSLIDEVEKLNLSGGGEQNSQTKQLSERNRAKTFLTNEYFIRLVQNQSTQQGTSKPQSKEKRESNSKTLIQSGNTNNMVNNNNNIEAREKRVSISNDLPKRQQSLQNIKMKAITPSNGQLSSSQHNSSPRLRMQNNRGDLVSFNKLTLPPNGIHGDYKRKSVLFNQFDLINNLQRSESKQKANRDYYNNLQDAEQHQQQIGRSQTQLAVIQEGSNKQIKIKSLNRIDRLDNINLRDGNDQANFGSQFNLLYQNYKIFDDFEKMQQYKFYFPQYNYDRIMTNLKRRRNFILQKQLNSKNKGVEDMMASITPMPMNKMQNKLSKQLGLSRQNTLGRSNYQQSKFYDNVPLKSMFESQMTVGSPKKTTQKTIMSPVNISANNNIDMMSFTNYQNLINSNIDPILSNEKLSDKIKDDFNSDQLQNQAEDKLLPETFPYRKNKGEKDKNTSIFNIKNVKFAPLKMKIKSKERTSDIDLDQFSNDL